MNSDRIRSQRNSILVSIRDTERRLARLESDLNILQEQCPHENKRTYTINQSVNHWYCLDCDAEGASETTDNESEA